MGSWFPPQYERIFDALDAIGKAKFGARWQGTLAAGAGHAKPEPFQIKTVQEVLRSQLASGERRAFLLDPNVGPIELKVHWWFSTDRANYALANGRFFKEPCEVFDTYDYGASRVSGAIGLAIEATAIASSNLAVQLTRVWLNEALDDRRFSRKTDFFQAAKSEYPRLSRRGFDKVWADVTDDQKHRWVKLPGPKSG